jgi:WD40 repeat protein
LKEGLIVRRTFIITEMWKVGLQLRRHTAPINAVSVDCNETLIATASADTTVGLYEWQTKRQVFLHGHLESVNDLAFAPNSTLLSTVSNDGNCIFWNPQTSENLHTIKGHQKPVRCCCWSPDGQYLVTGSHDRTAVVWSAAGYSQYQILAGLKGWVRSISWHDDLIAVGGRDKVILVYDARTG